MRTLSVSQIDVLHLLDKRGSARLPRLYSRTARILSDLGFVNYHIEKGIFGGGDTVRIVMTKKGADFVYNGGLDVPRPKA